MRQTLMGAVEKILKRQENKYALNLITGAYQDQKQKPRKIENWLQVELAKELSQPENMGVVSDITLEQSNHDIVAMHHMNDQSRRIAIELKIGPDTSEVHEDLKKLKQVENGYILFLLLMLTMDKPRKTYTEELLSREPMKLLSGYEQQLKDHRCICADKGSKYQWYLAIGCVHVDLCNPI